jgi:hypothetical protein
VVALLGVGIYLLVGFTKFWFRLDEWDFVANRGLRLGNDGIFFPHNEHWTTIPIIVWRGIFNLVGVRDYWVYGVPLVVAHLATAYLLWRFMLRHQVELWTATLLTIAFSVVGVGSQNLTWAFQLTFVGSVTFGMLAIDAIDTDRTWLAPLWCICSLMCADIGIPMVIACGFVAVVERKFRVAAIAVGAPAVVFMLWFLAIGYHGTASDQSLGSVHIGQVPGYVWTGLTSAVGGFLDAPHLVGVVAVLLLGAAAMVYRNAPAALAASVVPFYGFVGLGRVQFGNAQATASRYSYVAIALVLPLVGLMLTRLVRSVYLRPLVIVALGLLVAVNVVVLHRGSQDARFIDDLSKPMEAQLEAAAFLLNHGNSYPAQFLTDNPCALFRRSTNFAGCVAQDVPSVSTLAGWVKSRQFPVPTYVSPGRLQGEQAVLNVSDSPAPRFQRGMGRMKQSPCATLSYQPVTVESTSPKSVHIHVAPSMHQTIAIISFPALDGAGPLSTPLSLPKGDSWLNLPLGHYPTALITSSDAVQVCQGAVT